MTKEEILAAFEMRLEKKTYADIGEVLGLTPSAIHHSLLSVLSSNGKTRRRSPKARYIYENIENWMIENKVTFTAFALMCGVGETTIRLVLAGDRKPSKNVKSAILRVTGLSPEDAFKKREGWA